MVCMQVWVLINRETRHVCVAWRGTEQSKWQDMLTDLSLLPAAFTAERAAETGAGGLGSILSRVQVAWLEDVHCVRIVWDCR